jgi:purine-binding chemotaxis protein CheW
MEKSTEQGLGSETQIATFHIDKELFGIGIHQIKEIVRYPQITHVPRSEVYLKGLTNLRGNVLPVIDARVRLNLPVTAVSDRTRVLVIDVNESLIGVIVDNVKGVTSLENSRVEIPPPILASGVDSKFIRNVIHSNTNSQITMELNVEALCDIQANVSQNTQRASSSSSEDRETKSTKATVNERQLVTYLIGHEEYGFSIQTVQEILRVSKITEVPDAPPFVMGLLSLRNNLLPIVDLRKLFGMSSLVSNKELEVDRMLASYQNWMHQFKNSIGNDSIQYKDLDTVPIFKWIESFRTSSEKISKLLQNIRFFHQDINIQSKNLTSNSDINTIEKRSEFFNKNIEPLFDQLIISLNECKQSLETEIKEDQRILVIDINNQSIGILVDRMQQVIRVQEDFIDPPPTLIHADKQDNLQGIVKLENGNRLILLVDETKLFTENMVSHLTSINGEGKKTNNEVSKTGGDGLDQDEVQLVTFKLGNEEYGLFIEDVREINRLSSITVVPNAPAFVEGLMNLRGNVIPAIDLRKRFGLDTIQHGETTRVIIVDITEKTTGLIVDSVSDVIRISKKMIENPPDIISSKVETEFIQGIGNLVKQGRFIIVLDVNKILSGEEQALLQSAKA